MKKPVPVIGRIESGSGRTTMIKGAQLAGPPGRFIDCPVCGARVDMEDLGSVFEHEATCPGLPGDEPDQHQD